MRFERASSRSLRHKETFCVRERSRTDRNGLARYDRTLEQDRAERHGTERNPFTALWTTVSGFESLPPSHPVSPSFGQASKASVTTNESLS
jgi:hypothetical protein